MLQKLETVLKTVEETSNDVNRQLIKEYHSDSSTVWLLILRQLRKRKKIDMCLIILLLVVCVLGFEYIEYFHKRQDNTEKHQWENLQCRSCFVR
jgi:hypothetical protein